MKQLPGLDFLKSLDRKTLIDLGIRYGAVTLFLILVLLPSCAHFQSLKSQFQQKKSQLQTARLKLTQARKAQENRTAVMSEIIRQEDRFFTEEELSQMLSMVSELAKQNNLQMTASKPLKDQEKEAPPVAPPPPPKASAPGQPLASTSQTLPPYSHQEFEIDMSGHYHDLGKFLSDLRGYSKFIHAKSLSILNAVKQESGHEIKLTLRVYLKPQASA